MKIIMNKTAPGSVDGIRVRDYVAGAEYDLSGSAGARELAASFVASGLASEAAAQIAPAPVPAAEALEEIAPEPAAPAEPTVAKPGPKKKK